jgi:tRNA(Ile)-lysidine synthetase-like protein
MITVNPHILPKGKLFFATSGGIDSIAAAHWTKFRFRRKITILHFNHNVQAANIQMQKSVEKFAKDFGFDLLLSKRGEYDTGGTSESDLREWRLSEYEKIGGKFVTAHHLNDCVESYLDNCLKGQPTYMPIPWHTYFGEFCIFHPFLGTTKRDFIEYAEKNKLKQYVVEDPTNKETSQKRNWIRNVIVPEVEARNLGLEKVVTKMFYLNRDVELVENGL